MKINDFIKERNGRLHVACGANNFKEYANIDLFDYDPRDTSRDGAYYDFKEDLRLLNSVDNGSLSEIMFIHGFEHFTRFEAIEILKIWLNKLSDGGFIHCEMPDYRRVHMMSLLPSWCYNRSNKRYSKSIIHDMTYGNQWSGLDYETHRYLWSKREIKTLLTELGYTVRYLGNGTLFHIPFRDMVIVASKGELEPRVWKTRSVGGIIRKLTVGRAMWRNLKGLKTIFLAR